VAERRNVLSLDRSARRALLAGLRQMQLAGTYAPFVRRHSAAVGWTSKNGTMLNAAHMGPAFLPWHRKFILEFEAALQTAMQDSKFGLPYCDWTDGLGSSSPIWGADLMGGSGQPVTGPFAPALWKTVDGHGNATKGLNRDLGAASVKLPTRQDVHRLMYRNTYDSSPYNSRSSTGVRNALEGFMFQPSSAGPFLHNAFHVWIGGQMANVPVAANDPVFFLHHCNIDRIWAEWQLVQPSAIYVPTAGAAMGHNLNDPMYPWNTAGNLVHPADMLSISTLGYSYKDYYQIATLQIIITTGSNFLAGTTDEVGFTISNTKPVGGSTPFWSVILDPSHCDHPTPFQRGQTDTFTYKDVTNKEVNGVPLTPVTLGKFTLGKHGTSFTGDWTVASVKIVADGLVLYDNLVNQELNNAHQWLDDGKGNALNPAP
jgi:tyrosinase